VFNVQPNMPVRTYLLKTTVEFRMHMKAARATLIFVQYLVRDSFPRLKILKRSKLFRKRVPQRMENIAGIESWVKITSEFTS
jgi:hypothetical protein